MGLVDEVGPRHPEAYADWLAGARRGAGRCRATARARRTAKTRRLAAERVPLDAYEARELAEMSRDMYGDRSGFAAARHAFVTKAKPAGTAGPPAAARPSRRPRRPPSGAARPGQSPGPGAPTPVAAIPRLGAARAGARIVAALGRSRAVGL